MGKQRKQCQTLFFGGSKITADGDCSHDIKRCLLLERKVMTNLDSILKSRDITLPTKVHLVSSVQFSRSVMCDSLRPRESQHARPPCSSPSPRVHSDSCPSSPWCHPAISSSVVPFSYCPQSFPASSQGYGFSSSHVWMWELDYEESWALKNWCFWSVVLEKTLESPLDCKEIQPVHSEDQPWDFFGRNDAKAETPILWPPHAKSWLIGKDSDAGRDWGQEEKGMTQDEMAGWHHGLDGLESE